MSISDRRKAARVDIDLPIVLEGSDGEISGKALNISTNGIYFEIPHYIESMTKVQMGLVIPGQEGKTAGESVVSFDGVVVRVEPDNEDEAVSTYRIAVFFTHVPESSMEILSIYIAKMIKP